jgi:predicted acetyltransferase
MTMDRGALANTMSIAQLGPPLRDVGPLLGEGLVLRVRHAFRSEGHQVPGYVFDVTTSEGETVGTAAVLITNDLEKIRTTGHLGTEVLPEFRRQGYAAKIGRVVFPLLGDHGIHRVLLTFDDGHETQAAACRELGGKELDLLPPSAPGGTAKRRYTVDL